jgi:hypothetical protein
MQSMRVDDVAREISTRPYILLLDGPELGTDLRLLLVELLRRVTIARGIKHRLLCLDLLRRLAAGA